MQQDIDLVGLVGAALGTTATPVYLDRVSGQVLPAREVADRCGPAVAVQERYMRVPSIGVRLRLDDARDYVTTIQDIKVRARVEKILRGPRGPWAFEREVARWPEIVGTWRSWEHACATARILGWLGREGVSFTYPE